MSAIQAHLTAPFEKSQVIQVRTGKIRPLAGIPERSAIYKKPHYNTRLHLSTTGLEGDQQSFIRHGGPEKALLHYYSGHYESWKRELPASAHLFEPGGFGENLVTTGTANEHNVCIGDVLRIGPEVVVQVTLPRAPCYKLNHRFEDVNVSRMSQNLRRTGWLYRVLQTGTIGVGDEVILERRMHPQWTVAAVQNLLYTDMKNWDAMQTLISDVPELGQEFKDLFLNRLRKRDVEDHAQRLHGGPEIAQAEVKKWKKYRIKAKKQETPRILSLVLIAVSPSSASPLSQDPTAAPPGSHVRIKLPDDNLVRAYSIISGNSDEFEIAVALSTNSRGGSQYLHDSVHDRMELECSTMASSFGLADGASKHILIAGGIGITVFIASAKSLTTQQKEWELHYAVRTRQEKTAFARHFSDLGQKGVIHVYCSEEGTKLDIRNVIAKATTKDNNTHTYCCGPQRLMDEVVAATNEFGWHHDRVHFESFVTNSSGDAFTANLSTSRKEIMVEREQTLLDVLRATGLDIDSSCEVGNCGSCRVGVLRGQVDHRGTALLDIEKPYSMLSCVSRGIGHVVLDL